MENVLKEAGFMRLGYEGKYRKRKSEWEVKIKRT